MLNEIQRGEGRRREKGKNKAKMWDSRGDLCCWRVGDPKLGMALNCARLYHAHFFKSMAAS